MREVLDNFRGLGCPRKQTKTSGSRTRTRTCELVVENPRGQGLISFRTTRLTETCFDKRKTAVYQLFGFLLANSVIRVGPLTNWNVVDFTFM